MKYVKKIFYIKKINVLFREKIIFIAITIFLISCGDKIWKNHGDSCILISENPPLKRVINYTDHELCDRKLSPRMAPNPNTRFLKKKS